MALLTATNPCCFRTEATGAKRNTLISVFQASLTSSIEKSPSGPTSTVMSSVPSWAAPAESSVGHDLGNLGKKVFLFYLLITMADKLSAIAGAVNKIFKEVLQFVDYRFPSLVALLDGRNH